MWVMVVVTGKMETRAEARGFRAVLERLVKDHDTFRALGLVVGQPAYTPSKVATGRVEVVVTARVVHEAGARAFRVVLERLVKDYAPFRDMDVEVVRHYMLR